ELRAVAGAIKAAEPIGSEIGGRHLETVDGRTAQMRADAFHDEKGLLDAAVGVSGVGRLYRVFRSRVRELRRDLRQRLEHAAVAMDDVDRAAAPLDLEQCARLELADVHLNRRAQGLSA